MLLIDIALPRDIDPAVAEMPGVHLYNLDDLEIGVNEGIRLRNQEVIQVQEIIIQEVSVFNKMALVIQCSRNNQRFSTICRFVEATRIEAYTPTFA